MHVPYECECAVQARMPCTNQAHLQYKQGSMNQGHHQYKQVDHQVLAQEGTTQK